MSNPELLTVRLRNSGGELDSRTVLADEAAKAAISIIQDCGELHDGDTIEIIATE